MPKKEHRFLPVPEEAKSLGIKDMPFAIRRERSVREIAETIAQNMKREFGMKVQRTSVLEQYLTGIMVAQHRNMLGEVYRIVESASRELTRDELLDWLYKRAVQITEEQDVRDPEELLAAEQPGQTH